MPPSSSEPAPGQRLAAAPGVVVLRFSEPLVKGLSRLVVTDPTGTRSEGSVSGSTDIVARLGINAPGLYRVAWKTVSPADGHTLTGSFAFGVGVTPGEAEAQTRLAPRGLDLALAALRALEYAALLASVGMLLLGRLARRAPALEGVKLSVRVPMAAALGAGVAVVAGEALAASSSLGALSGYVGTAPAAARLARLVLEAAALWAAGARPRLAVVPTALALLALTRAGHAGAVRPAWLGVAIDAVHLASAGLWAGGILGLALVRIPGGRGLELRARLLERFSPVALPAFVVTVATGVVRAQEELHRPADLVGAAYGRVLGFKILAVLAMVPLSAMAWRGVIRRPRAEALVALVVIGAAAVLAAFPLPPGRLAEAEAQAREAALASAFPRPGDLTLGGYAGDTLLGLTLRPASPGRNDLLLYVLPLEGEERAGDVRAELRLGGSAVGLDTCGPTCRKSALTLGGGETLEVRVAGRGGGRTAFAIPPLPVPPAGGLLAGMQARMGALRTLRIEEVLRPARPPVEARYAIEAPDRMDMKLNTGFESVTIGATRYSRPPGGAWQVEEGAPPLTVPFFIWSPPPFVAACIVGSEEADGTALREVAFFEDRGGTPLWFRLWIGPDALVRRAEMRAHGHFMDRYSDFDAPLRIDKPEGAPTS